MTEAPTDRLEQTDLRRRCGRNWPCLGVAAIVVAAVIILWLAPEEATLGRGIRSVYVHVSLIWVGIAGFAVAGLLGLALLFTGHAAVYPWMRTIGWAGVGFFAAGLATSAVASQVNWGAVFWQEPRMHSSTTSLAIAIMVMAVMGWFPWLRVRGTLVAAVPLIFFWLTARTELALHPANPIFTSNSLGIQATFAGLFLLAALAAALLVWQRVRMKR